MAKVKLEKEVVSFLEDRGTIVYSKEGICFFNIPFWYKETEKDGVFEEFNFHDLPEDVKETIHECLVEKHRLDFERRKRKFDDIGLKYDIGTDDHNGEQFFIINLSDVERISERTGININEIIG